VAFDFRCVEDLVFKPGEYKLVETWLVVEVPEWYYLQTSPRSSTFKKHWLMQTNSVWIIDRDYCWDNDTIKFPYINLSWKKQIIEEGTRIGQGVFLRYNRAEFEVVETMWDNKNRGGFWSTGVK
jgi:dUTP pyrophosphatase